MHSETHVKSNRIADNDLRLALKRPKAPGATNTEGLKGPKTAHP